MNIKQKIERIVARNPELKPVLQSLENEKQRKVLTKIMGEKISKIIIIGKNSEERARLHELALAMQYYPHIIELTTQDLLDAYVGNEEDEDRRFTSLSQVVDDVVIICDSRAYVPNKQKSNMIMQVFEQNTHVIYYYKGTHTSFINEHHPLIEYAHDNSIPIVRLEISKSSITQEV